MSTCFGSSKGNRNCVLQCNLLFRYTYLLIIYSLTLHLLINGAIFGKVFAITPRIQEITTTDATEIFKDLSWGIPIFGKVFAIAPRNY